MHLAFLHSDIRLFSSKHSLTSVDRCDRKRRLDQNVFFVLQFRLYACLLSYQCRSCGTGPAYIHQSSHTCNPPEPGHTDRSRSRSVFRTPLLANPQKLCMGLSHVKHSVSLNIREDTIPGWKQLPSMAQVIHYMDESSWAHNYIFLKYDKSELLGFSIANGRTYLWRCHESEYW